MTLGVLLAVPLIAALLLLRVRPGTAQLVHALAVAGLLGAAAAVVGAVAQATSLTALGFARRTLSGNGRDAQSSAFFSTPGMEALYSGVAMSSASAAAICARSTSTAAGARAPSASSS